MHSGGLFTRCLLCHLASSAALPASSPLVLWEDRSTHRREDATAIEGTPSKWSPQRSEVLLVAWETAQDSATPANSALPRSKIALLKGVAPFLLALVPFVYVLVAACTGSGVVVVAREQVMRPVQQAVFEKEVVLVASIEHDFIYDLNIERPEKSKATAGGLGKVAGQLQWIHPTDLISVHPVFGNKGKNKYGFEQVEGIPEARRGWQQDDPIIMQVDGEAQTVQVHRLTVPPKVGEESTSPQVTYLLLEHPWFRNRDEVYLDQPGSTATLRFFSLWNQAVGILIAREEPKVYQCPDYHTALAPWYAMRASGRGRVPPRVSVVLHNAEYQGAITSQQLNSNQVTRLARILDLPPSLVRRRMMIEGGFNMMQAGLDYVMLNQAGYGVCAVSETYAEESKVKHRVLWPLPEVVGLDNPMLENERPRNPNAPDPPLPLAERRRRAKAALYSHRDFSAPAGEDQQGAGYGYLMQREGARIFVFLGRWVKQKGMDYIADIAQWMVSRHENLQLVMLGPPADSFGTYSKLKLQRIATDPRFLGRIKVIPEFYRIDEQLGSDAKFAFDFCFMPSRDEPFGYVDIEFGWFGSLTVGAVTGGLGKVPGVYYIPSNVNSAAHICHLLKGCVDKAMGLSDVALLAVAENATRYSFPVEKWQAELLALYGKACQRGKPDTNHLQRCGEVQELFDSQPAVPRNRKVPRRGAPRSNLGVKSLEPNPQTFSVDDMGRQTQQAGVAAAPNDFIRREIDDSAIRPAVEQLVQRAAEQESKCCTCKAQESAQEVLAVTQWSAMRNGEFEESRPRTVRQPFCGVLNGCIKYLTSWLAGEAFGLKRIDAAITIQYLLSPLLQALCLSSLPDQDRNDELNTWPSVVGAIVLPVAILFWTGLSTKLQPNRVMAVSMILRVPVVFLKKRYLLFCCLAFLTGADQIFVFYNFMGAAVGDISKLALRMGMCNGLVTATAFFGRVAVRLAVEEVPKVSTPAGSVPVLVFVGIGFSLVLTLLYVCAPAAYREFCLPEWDLRAMLRHRRSLKFLGVNIVLGAVTDPSISASAIVIWRTVLPPFASHRFLGMPADEAYMWLLPSLLAVSVILWSYALYRLPNTSMVVVKAFAFLMVPPALLRSLLAIFIENYDDSVPVIDTLFLLSLVLDVVHSTCVYIAVLSVVGSRWRFVSFVTVALFLRGVLSAVVEFILAAFFEVTDMQAADFASRWLVMEAGVALLQWLLSVGGVGVYDRESMALLTAAKKKLARDNNKGLKRYLRSLEDRGRAA